MSFNIQKLVYDAWEKKEEKKKKKKKLKCKSKSSFVYAVTML